MDYSSAEVHIAACYSQDPSLIRYVTDSSADMHHDLAADVFLMAPEEIAKPVRQATKGHATFGWMYGSYYKQVAPLLWEDAEIYGLKDHLSSKGIKTYESFEKHIQGVEDVFWNERFAVHNKWRKSQYEFYKTHGYVELLNGFRCYGPMVRNATFNYPVQGSAAHCLLWGLNQVQKEIESKLERSKLICQIHDAAVFSVHPSEEAWIDKWMYEYCTQKVREHWPWIIVPLKMEKEASEVNKSWADVISFGILKGE